MPCSNFNIDPAFDQQGFLIRLLMISRSLKDRLGEATALDHLGRAYELLKNGKDSLDSYNQALMLRRGVGYLPGVAQTLLNIGMLDESQRMPESALDAYERALRITRSIADQRGEATILSKVAVVHAKLGALETARGGAASAVLIAESLRAKVAIPELRASYFATVHDCYETYIDVLMQLQNMRASENYQRDALAISERAKARVLLDMLRESHAEIRRGVAANLLDREESIHRQIDARTDIRCACSAVLISASVLQVLRELPSRPSPPKLVAVLADPVFDRTDSRIATSIRAAEGDLQNTTGNRSAAVPSMVTDGFTRLEPLPFTRQLGGSFHGQGLIKAWKHSTSMLDCRRYRAGNFDSTGLCISPRTDSSIPPTRSSADWCSRCSTDKDTLGMVS